MLLKTWNCHCTFILKQFKLPLSVSITLTLANTLIFENIFDFEDRNGYGVLRLVIWSHWMVILSQRIVT